MRSTKLSTMRQFLALLVLLACAPFLSLNTADAVIVGSGAHPTQQAFNASICYIGDSFVSNGLVISGANYTYPAAGFSTYVAPLANRGGLVTPLGASQGVVGQTMAQIAARTSALVAFHCPFVAVEGGINSVLAGVDGATIAAQRLSAIQAFTADGSIVLSPNITPTFGAAALTAPQETQRLAANTIMATFTAPNVIPVNVAALLPNSSFFDAGGLHPNTTGSVAYGGGLASGISSRVTSGDISTLLSSGTNFAANAFFTGITGTLTGATGIMASNWDLQAGAAGGATVVASKAANGRQILTITGTVSGSGTVFMQDFIGSAPAAGHVIEQVGTVTLLADPVGLGSIETVSYVLDSGFSALAQAHIQVVPVTAAQTPIPIAGPQIATPVSGQSFVQNQFFLNLNAGTVNISIEIDGLGTHQVS